NRKSAELGKVLDHLTPKRGRDVATPFDDPTEDPLDDLDERTRDVAKTLINRRRLFHQARRRIEDPKACSFLFVMTPERLPILETDRAVRALEEVHIPVAGTLINRVIPADADGAFLQARREQEASYLARIDSLFARLPRPMLPWLPTDVQGIEVLELLAGKLEQQGF
ncbi:MAG: ArsA family ATPase, partial [Halomonas sp.]|nr:ArsA family ATPase [Halomonas sp.]